MGVTNQRETLVVFERDGMRPVAPAIVWQCRRSAALCAEHRARGEEDQLRKRTGLLLDPYFTATKLEWLLAEQPELRARAERGELCAGTVDTWLIARLTGGAALVTDASNASRTLLYDLTRGEFDDGLCAQFGVPRQLLPEVRDSAGRVAMTDPASFLGLRLPVSGIAGDQQAALFGQACLRAGMSKNTYGTGSFVLVNTGTAVPAPVHGLLGTVAWRLGGTDTFALEGSIFVTGAGLKWLRDGLGLITATDEAGPLFDSVPDSNGCIFVPALSGLGAPYWDPDARGALLGLTAGVNSRARGTGGGRGDGLPHPRRHRSSRTGRRDRARGAAGRRRRQRHGRPLPVPGGPSRPPGDPSGISRDHRAGRSDAGGSGGGPHRHARRCRGRPTNPAAASNQPPQANARKQNTKPGKER